MIMNDDDLYGLTSFSERLQKALDVNKANTIINRMRALDDMPPLDGIEWPYGGFDSILEHVGDITSGDRRRDYGRPLINHLRIALNWSMFLGIAISPTKVAWMMVGLKLAREANTPKYDNALDTLGYVACIDDMVRQVVELGLAGSYAESLEYLWTLDMAGMGKLFDILIEAENE